MNTGILISTHEKNSKAILSCPISLLFQPCYIDYCVSLGARGYLPSVYIVITLWFFKQCAQSSAGGDVLSSFTKCPSIWSQCALWVHAGCIVKVPIKMAIGHFVKELPCFFHDFVYNVSSICLSHSLGVLSKYVQWCGHKVFNQIENL